MNTGSISTGPISIVHLARGPRFDKVWTPAFIDALEAIGPLTFHERGKDLDDEAAAELIRPHDVAIAGWDARLLPVDLATDPGALRYICSYSGTIRHSVPRELVEAGIPVSNWGDLPAPGIAESAMTLLLTCVHDMARIRRAQESGEWGYDASRAGTLNGLAVGIYGLGVIGRRFVEVIAQRATLLGHEVLGPAVAGDPLADAELFDLVPHQALDLLDRRRLGQVDIALWLAAQVRVRIDEAGHRKLAAKIDSV